MVRIKSKNKEREKDATLRIYICAQIYYIGTLAVLRGQNNDGLLTMIIEHGAPSTLLKSTREREQTLRFHLPNQFLPRFAERDDTHTHALAHYTIVYVHISSATSSSTCLLFLATIPDVPLFLYRCHTANQLCTLRTWI